MDVEALHADAADKYFKGDYAGAEDLYKKVKRIQVIFWRISAQSWMQALAANPKHLRSLCNYGALLHNIKNEYDKVRCEALPSFLFCVVADCRQAAEMYSAALKVDKNDVVRALNSGLTTAS